jgi:hypothetical protein
MNRKVTIALSATGMAGAAALWVYMPTVGAPIGLMVASLLVFSTLFSNAGKLSVGLGRFVGQTVKVAVWGESLRHSDGSSTTFQVVSVRALGAGLHIKLRSLPGGSMTPLKIAQPANSQFGDDWVKIEQASYVQWGRIKLKNAKERTETAFSMHVVDSSLNTGHSAPLRS